MKKGRWFIPIAIAVGAISTIAYGPIWYLELENREKSVLYIRRLFMSDYTHAYLLCGLYNHLETHKGGVGSCYIDPDTEVLTKAYCYPDGDPFCEEPLGVFIPKSSLDTCFTRDSHM